MVIAKHIVKFTELYEEGKLKADDVGYEAAELAEDDKFDIAIDKFNYVGEIEGKHEFALSIRSLIDARERMAEDLAAKQVEFDDFCDKVDRVIAVLQEIKDSKPKEVVDNEEIVIKL